MKGARWIRGWKSHCVIGNSARDFIFGLNIVLFSLMSSLLLFSFPIQTLPYHIINDLLLEPGELELKHRTSNRSDVVFHYVDLDSLPMCGPIQFQYVTKIVRQCNLLYVLRTEVLTVDADVT